ncbi:MAG: 3-oxoacyl-ACP synthase [Candidatus Omnitrophota bacterium]|jgi:uncharacterized protein (DUF4415 family)|nr:MAG: 3-oxoacyl-ACP synthase [Candidatus Omnitrophota bacterium]
MKKELIMMHADELGEGQTDWTRIGKQTDAEIEAAIASDPDAAPILDEAWFKKAKLVMPRNKTPISIHLDADVLEWFKTQGERYQTHINAVLRAYMKAHSQ